MLSSEQLALRLTGIGASEIGAVLEAEGAWESSLSVWARKVGVSQPSEGPVPEYIELGNLLEPAIATLYCRRNPDVELRECGTLVHPKDPIQIATPDRLIVGQPKGLQIKKAMSRGKWGAEGTDEVPENILCQVQWEMSVANLDLEDVPVLFWGSKLVVYTVRRDDELIGHMVDLAHKWWTDHVIARRPPEPDGREQTKATLNSMFRESSGQMIPAPPNGQDLAVRYKDASKRAEMALCEKEALGNALRLAIGEAEGFGGFWGRVTWKPGARGRTLRVSLRR